MALVKHDGQPKDLGEVLVRVKQDLLRLREKLESKDSVLSPSDIESAIQKTEEALQFRAQDVIQQLNNHVQTLPPLEHQHVAALTWHPHTHRQGDASMALIQAEGGRQRALPTIHARHSHRRAFLEPILGAAETSLGGASPGQMAQALLKLKLVADATQSENRKLLRDGFGVEAPSEDATLRQRPTGKMMKGNVTKPVGVLPREFRLNPGRGPPLVSENDIKHGILNMTERGIIPPGANLVLHPEPVHQEVLVPQPASQRLLESKSMVAVGSGEGAPPDPLVRLDQNYRMSVGEKEKNSIVKATLAKAGEVKEKSAATLPKGKKEPIGLKTIEFPKSGKPAAPPGTPTLGGAVIVETAVVPKMTSHRFPIQNGRVRETMKEFMAFKERYYSCWGAITVILRRMEEMLVNFNVPIAFVDGDKLAQMAFGMELHSKPTNDQLLNVLINREDVQSLIQRPGRIFQGPDGNRLAAITIQAQWRMYHQRQEYLEYRRQKWAAGVIAISWIMSVKLSRVRQQLKQTRIEHLEHFKIRAKEFARNWPSIKKSRRVVIHCPSLGYNQTVRSTIDLYNVRQNTQMARLCDIRDPNVDVILISPINITDDIRVYYDKLLGLKPALETGQADAYELLSDRFKIIFPHASKNFQAHPMSLSTLLYYSPRSLRRIKNLIKGRVAYLVPGVMHRDDMAVAAELGIPILGSDPEVAQLYSTKSGCKRIFAAAKVATPPGEFDLYSLEQLHESLAQLITENLEVQRWLFKLDVEFDSRGTAYCDVPTHLKCYDWCVKEAQRYGAKWSKKWAQEPAYRKILAELPEIIANNCIPVNTDVYPTWQEFLEAFLSQGGVIEACSPSDNSVALAVDMLIEPHGEISMVCAGDQVHAQSDLVFWGLSVPQSSIKPETLNKAANDIAEACKQRGIVGYFTIDFLTFIDGKTGEQQLWALDLDVRYSDTVAMYGLLEFLTNGKLDSKEHVLNVPRRRKEKFKIPKHERTDLTKIIDIREVVTTASRYAILSTRLLHSNMTIINHNVFFQMCRAYGIGYDIREKSGTIFTMMDQFHRDHFGMITIDKDLQKTLATFAKNLFIIHKEISSSKMQGDTNFIPVIHNIESILGITVQNALNTVDDEAAESNMDADDDDDSSESEDDDDDADAEERGANFVVAPVADPAET